ncbi:MAG: glycosyltransferase family 2 protein [Planctomycetaceae bacterium]
MIAETDALQPMDLLDIAVLIPCHNEAAAIAQVVTDFRQALPSATVFVYDNNSTDDTAAVAAAAGAIVRSEPRKGKGNVVRRMFSDIEADVYVMVDGDDTYEAAAAPGMVRALIEQRLDMVNGKRVTEIEKAYRTGHRFGNWMLTTLVGFCFGREFDDILSGFRVFSRRFVKSFPALSRGFETETELTVHALELRLPVAEVETAYKDRPEGSVSKLNTYRDGLRILKTIIVLAKEERPLAFFSAIWAVLAMVSIGLAIPLFVTYFETGLVPRFPTAILATGCMLLAFASLTCGLVLDTVTRARREMKRLAYLQMKQLQATGFGSADSRFRDCSRRGAPARAMTR